MKYIPFIIENMGLGQPNYEQIDYHKYHSDPYEIIESFEKESALSFERYKGELRDILYPTKLMYHTFLLIKSEFKNKNLMQ